MVMLEIQHLIFAHSQWLISVSWWQVSSCPVRIQCLSGNAHCIDIPCVDAAICHLFFFFSFNLLLERKTVYTQLYSLLVIFQYAVIHQCSFLNCYITKEVNLRNGYLFICMPQANLFFAALYL